MISNKKIFITGGAGFLGKNLVRRYYEENEITIFSRDESKHYYLKKQYPRINCIVGDVRNYDLLRRKSSGHDYGIFAASMKQIEAVDQNVEEGVRIIIDGGINSRRISEENEFEAACFISSDKSRAATTLYGSMKFVAGESFIVNDQRSKVRLSSAIYGNVLNSTGSVVPLIWDAIINNYSLTLYSPEMTRFSIDVESAMDLIESGLQLSGVNVIPNLRSFSVLDLFEVFKVRFGLSYKMGIPRISEKLHEIMISPEEYPRTIYDEERNIFVMHHENISTNPPILRDRQLSSKDVCMQRDELESILASFNFFQPGI